MRDDRDQISFVPVEPRHYPLLKKWLGEPHVQEWWGEPDAELSHIRDMAEGRDTTRPFLIAVDGIPVGYIQYWFVGHHQNEEWIKDHPWLAELPSETIGVDLTIGQADRLSAGIGSRALAAFVASLRTEGHQTIIIDPDTDNARGTRLYQSGLPACTAS